MSHIWKNNNAVHQRFLPLPLKHPVSHLVLADWELSLVIPRGMVPLLQSSTFLYRRKLVLLTRLYNCVYVQRYQISWFPSVDRESLWLSYVPRWWSAQALYLCLPDSYSIKLLKETNQSICFRLELMLACTYSWAMWFPLLHGELPVHSSCLKRPLVLGGGSSGHIKELLKSVLLYLH